MADATSLDGKVALVTGAAGGLGRGIARRLAASGAAGVAVDIVDGTCPDGWQACRCDVSDESSLQESFDLVRTHFGRLDIVVANAGVVPPWRETADIDLAEWDRVFAVNVRGIVATIKLAVPLLQDRGGSIIVMGSLNSVRGHPRQCLYVASKHAVLGIVRATALDLGRHGIRVNGIAPGAIATDALVGRVTARAVAGGPAVDRALDDFAAQTALGRMATEADVADTALYLASSLSDGVTGQMLPVDGGLA